MAVSARPAAVWVAAGCHILGAVDFTRAEADMLGILDPTIAAPRARIDYVPRPAGLAGLRIGLIENTKKNSESVLRALAEKAARVYGMKMEVLVHKSQRAPLTDTQLAELRGRTDFALVGVGD
jgi:hypothetical protein